MCRASGTVAAAPPRCLRGCVTLGRTLSRADLDPVDKFERVAAHRKRIEDRPAMKKVLALRLKLARTGLAGGILQTDNALCILPQLHIIERWND